MYQGYVSGIQDQVEVVILNDSVTTIMNPGTDKTYYAPEEGQIGWHLAKEHNRLPGWDGRGRSIVAWVAHNELYSRGKGGKFPCGDNWRAIQGWGGRLETIKYNVSQMVATSSSVIIVLPLGWAELASTFHNNDGQPYDPADGRMGQIFDELVNQLVGVVQRGNLWEEAYDATVR